MGETLDRTNLSLPDWRTEISVHQSVTKQLVAGLGAKFNKGEFRNSENECQPRNEQCADGETAASRSLAEHTKTVLTTGIICPTKRAKEK